jgi:hypothetical protein
VRPLRKKPIRFSLRFVFRLMTNVAASFATIGIVAKATHDVQAVLLLILFFASWLAVFCAYFLTKRWAMECVFVALVGVVSAGMYSNDMRADWHPIVGGICPASGILLVLTYFLCRWRSKKAAWAERCLQMKNPFSEHDPELSSIRPPLETEQL